MRAYLRGSAFDSTEGNNTTFTLDGQPREMLRQRGINTVILNPNGTFKAKGNHDVYGSAARWDTWADWLRNAATAGDIIAVASYDAVRSAPGSGAAADLLRSIHATRAFATEAGTDWRNVRTPYALLFAFGGGGCLELHEPHQGPNVHLNALINRVYLRGSAFDSPEGNETFLEVNGKRLDMTTSRGLNTVVLHPDGRFKARAHHDVYGNAHSWHTWAEWVGANAAPGDHVAVASFDAVRSAPRTGPAANLLHDIGAEKAFATEAGTDWRNVRTPYTLFFTRGERACREVLQPHRGINAHLRASLIVRDEAQRSSRPVLHFDGQSTYLSREIDVSEKDFTVSLWFKTSKPDVGLLSVDAGDRGTQGHDRHVYLQGGNVGARLWSNEVIVSNGHNFADGNWHRLTYVFGSGYDGQRIYVDGRVVASGRKNQSDFSWQNGINIGYSNDAAQPYFEGEMAEVSLWNVARSARDVAAWRERVAGNENGLQALWYFADRQGGEVRDYTVNHQHATIHGTVRWGLTEDFPGEFLINIQPEDIEQIRSEGERLSTVGTTLRQAVTTEPNTTEEELPISALIAGGLFPQYDLMLRLRESVVDNGLTFTKATLGEYGDIADFAAGILDLFVRIENPKIALIAGEPGIVGEPGMEFTEDPSGSDKLATPDNHKTRVSGDVTYFQTFTFNLSADFFQRKGKPRFAFRSVSETPLGIGTFLPGVPLLQALKLTGPTFIITNSATLYDPGLDSGINEGFNFFGNLKIADSDDDAMRFIGGILKVRELAIHAAVDLSGVSKKIVLEAAVQREVTLIDGAGIKLRYTRSDVGIELSGQPMEPTVGVSHDLVVTLQKDGADTHLVFTGGIKIQAESISGFFTMNGTGRSPQGALSGEVQNTGEWENPFGIPGITIRQMSVQLGGTYAVPWIDNVGIHGNLKIGDVDGSISVLVDSNDPDQFVLAGSSDRLTMLQIMSFMSVATFAAYQALPASAKNAFNKIVDVKLEDVKVNIVPAATSIGGVHFRDEGVTIMGRLDLWGWEASTFINVDTFDGLTVRMDMDPLDVMGVFKLSGAQSDPHPILRMRVGPSAAPYLYGSVKAQLLGLSAELQLEASAQGLTFLFNQRWGNILTTHLSCTYGNGNFTASGKIAFSLNVTISTVFGNIPLVDVGFDAATTIRAGIDHGFYLSAAGSFRFYGKQITFPTLELNIAPRDFAALYQAVVKRIQDEAIELFSPIFGTLAEWADAVAKGVIDFGGDVAHVAKNVYNASRDEAIKAYKTLRRGATEIARGLKNVYSATSKEVAAALKAAGFAVQEVARALEDAYRLGSKVAAQVLRSVGYAAGEVGNALKSVYSLSAQGMAEALKYAGYGVEEVGRVVKAAYNLSSQALAHALRGAGYAAGEVANALKSAFNLSATGMAQALKYAGFGANEVGQAVKNAFGLTSQALAQALKGAGYAANEVGNALKSAFNLSSQGMATALKYAGFGVSEVGNFVKSAYNLGPKALETALKGAGYAGNEIKGFFKSLGGAFADFFGSVGDVLNPGNW